MRQDGANLLLAEGIFQLLRSLAKGVIGRIHVVHGSRNRAVAQNVLDGEGVFVGLGEERGSRMTEEWDARNAQSPPC